MAQNTRCSALLFLPLIVLFTAALPALAQVSQSSNRDAVIAAQTSQAESAGNSAQVPVLHFQAVQHGVPWREPTASGPIGFAAPAGAHLSYFGGPVISNVHVVQVLYGSGSYNAQVAGTSTPSMGNFYRDISISGFITLLNQYSTTFSGGTNQTIGNGTFDGLFQIVPSPGNNGSTISDVQIQSELLSQISAGNLPAPVFDAGGNVNTLYMLFFPPGKTITEGGSTSCVPGGFCAYHGTTSSTFNSKHLLYGVHPDMQPGSGCANGCGTSATFGNYTSVTSHELAEAISDADVGIATTFAAPLAWYDQNNGEIGDICNGQQGAYLANGTTYTIQLEFSNAQSNCVLPPPSTATAPLALTTAVNPVANTMDVDFIGADGHVHLFWYNGIWNKADLSALTGAQNASSTGGIKAIFNSIANTMEVHYIGSDQHVHTLWYNGTWHTTDLTASTGAPNAASNTSVTASMDSIANTEDVEYIGTDNHVHQLWYNGLWHTTDLTVASGAAANADSRSGINTLMNAIANAMEVHYIGTDHHIYSLFFPLGGGGAWHEVDHTTLEGAPLANTGSPLTSAADTIASTEDLEYVGTDQHIHQLWYNGLWHNNDLTVASGAANLASNGGLHTLVNSIANTMEVHYVGTDQHVYALWYNGAWHSADLTATTGAPPAIAASSLTSSVDTVGNTVDVEYVGADQHIHQLWYNGLWHTTDLTATVGP